MGALAHGVWSEGRTAAAPRIVDMAKRLETPLIDADTVIRIMKLGAEMAIHEIEMELVQSGKQSVSVPKLCGRFQRLRASLDTVTKVEGK